MNTATLFTPNFESQLDVTTNDNESDAIQSATLKKITEKATQASVFSDSRFQYDRRGRCSHGLCLGRKG